MVFYLSGAKCLFCQNKDGDRKERGKYQEQKRKVKKERITSADENAREYLAGNEYRVNEQKEETNKWIEITEDLHHTKIKINYFPICKECVE